MAIFYQKDSGLNQGINALGQGLAQGINQYGQATSNAAMQKYAAMKKKADLSSQGTVLQKLISELPADATPIQVANIISKGISQGLDPTLLKTYAEVYKSFKKEDMSLPDLISYLTGENSAPQGPEQIDITTMSEENIPGQGVPSTQKEPDNPLKNLSDQKLTVMSASNIPGAAALAKTEFSRRDMDRKKFREDRDFAYKRAGPYIEKIDEERRSVRDQTEALNLMEDALLNENLGFFSPDNFANFLGKYGEGLRTSKGAQLITAQKEFLVSDIGRVGARPNQWIEQQISSALTRIGRSKEANLSVKDALQARVDRNKKRIELTDQVEEEYMRPPEQGGLGYVPGNIAKIVDARLAPYEQEIQNKLAYRIRQNFEEENASNLRKLSHKKVPPGTPLTPVMARVFLEEYGKDKAESTAKKLGYTITSADEVRKFSR